MLMLSVIARLPLAMFSIGLLVHAEHLTGSFAAAGLVTAAYAVALGGSGPLLGRVVDRRGQTGVLVGAAGASFALLLVVAFLPVGVPLMMVVALAAGIGLATPPIGACVRTLLRDAAAFAVEATAVELTWVFGPPLALGVGALFSTGVALAGAGAVLLAATLVFAAHPASRGWRPAPRLEVAPRGALRSAGLQTLVLVMLAVGVLFGAVELGVAAASETLGATAAAGPLLGVWGVGSLLGGTLAARAARRAASGGGVSRLSALLLALTAAHLALVAASANVYALAAVLFLAGAAIAPTYATVYSLVEGAAPAGAVTEAFAWLATAVAVGAAIGAAAAGSITEQFGPSAVFVLAGAAGALALVATSVRAGTVTACPTS